MVFVFSFNLSFGLDERLIAFSLNIFNTLW